MRIFNSKEAYKLSNDSYIYNGDIEELQDINFETKFIVNGNIKCKGQIHSRFDLIVNGDMTAGDICVEGNLICSGTCRAEGLITVHSDMRANKICANRIEVQDDIVADSIETDSILSKSGNILVSKTMMLKSEIGMAKCNNNILCGTTISGVGKVKANNILTSENLRVDDDAVEGTVRAGEHDYAPVPHMANCSVTEESAIYITNENYNGYLEYLLSNAVDEIQKRHIAHWKYVTEKMIPLDINECTDISLYVWLVEMANSQEFCNWPSISRLCDAAAGHFESMVQTEIGRLTCSINNKQEWQEILSILDIYGNCINVNVARTIRALVWSKFGIKMRLVDKLTESWN